jgi:hypothetical protein
LIILINAFDLWKKSNFLLIPQKLVIYHTKNLCNHLKHALFYLWLKCEQFEQILLVLLSPFQLNCAMKHDSRFIFQGTLKHVLIIQITKNHHHFNQVVCEYLIKKLSNKLLMVIQSNVLIAIFNFQLSFNSFIIHFQLIISWLLIKSYFTFS